MDQGFRYEFEEGWEDEPRDERLQVPRPALLLGVLGVLPFVISTTVTLLAPEPWSGYALSALTYYGAVILSFLGGIQWGLAILHQQQSPGLNSGQLKRLVLSVIPSLISWGALMLPLPLGALVLAATFAFVLVIDLRLTHEGYAPVWYPRLRLPLTMAVTATLVLGATA